jgi:hypothetical protein
VPLAPAPAEIPVVSAASRLVQSYCFGEKCFYICLFWDFGVPFVVVFTPILAELHSGSIYVGFLSLLDLL